MKHILCFGDSNTHGFIPYGGRYDDNTRWTRLLANNLGNDYLVIEEGLNSRTTSLEDPFSPYKNAMDYIVPCLKTHEPLDLILVMLGSNDMKSYFSPSVDKIAAGIRGLLDVMLENSEAQILLVSPIFLGDNMKESPFADTFSDEAIGISHKLGAAYEQIAREYKIHFIDAATIAEPSPKDSLHLEPEGHRQLAEAFTKKILEIL